MSQSSLPKQAEGAERLTPGRRIAALAFRSRRRFATAVAIAIAVLLGYHVIFGQNGITVYEQKRLEDRVLTQQIKDLQEENSQLKGHVDRLQTSPDAIEHEAREKLHYTRPGEVIYTLDEKSGAGKAAEKPLGQGSDAVSKGSAVP